MVLFFGENEELRRILEYPVAKTQIECFDPFSMPHWKGSAAVEIANRSNDKNLRMLTESTSGKVSSSLFVVPDIDRALEEVNQKEHSCGRTGAEVRDADDSYCVREAEFGLGSAEVVELRKIDQEWVLKRNPTREEDELEYRIYAGLNEKGLPVPEARLTPEGIAIRYVGTHSLARHVFEAEHPSDEDSLVRMQSDMMMLVSNLDHAVAQMLTEKDKAGIRQRCVQRIAGKFRVDHSLARERYHALRIMEAIPGCDSEAIALVGGIEQVLDKCVQKYGAWTADVNPKNVFPVIEDGRYQRHRVIDFNRVKFASMQEADALAFDAFLPKKGLDQRPTCLSWNGLLSGQYGEPKDLLDFARGVFDHLTPADFGERRFLSLRESEVRARLVGALQNSGGRSSPEDVGRALGSEGYDRMYCTSVCDEATRQALTGGRFRKYQELTGDRSSVMDYAQHIAPARFYVGLRQARYALDEMLRSDNFQAIFNKFIEVQHHLNIALNCLDATARQQVSPEAYDGLRGYILRKFNEAAVQVPREVIEVGEAWFKMS